MHTHAKSPRTPKNFVSRLSSDSFLMLKYYIYKKMSEKYLGTDFDAFLKEEGMFEHCQAVAVKRVLAYQLQQFMEKNQLAKTEMASDLWDFVWYFEP